MKKKNKQKAQEPSTTVVGEALEEEGEARQQEAGVEQEVRMQLKGEVRGEGGLWVIYAPNTADNPLTHTQKTSFSLFFFPPFPTLVKWGILLSRK